eukprot:5131782-Heterocapsa_arctica.AAC.1
MNSVAARRPFATSAARKYRKNVQMNSVTARRPFASSTASSEIALAVLARAGEQAPACRARTRTRCRPGTCGSRPAFHLPCEA